MRLRLAAACALWLVAVTAWGADPQESLNQARAAYDRGDYAAAAAAYTQLLASGIDRAEVYYDLGNTEFKAGHIGRAIAAYRRALKRAPQDEDIRYNLNYARSIVRQPAERTGPLTRLAQTLVTWFPAETLARAALALYLLLAGLAGALLATRGRTRWLLWTVAAAAAAFVFLAAWASLRIATDRSQRWGVVVALQSEARNGPNASFAVGFVIPEGREVRLLGREGDWVAVGLPAEGYKGWVPAGEVLEDE